MPETLFDRVPDVVFCVKDRAGRYVVVNATCVERFGAADKAALIGKTATEVFPGPLAAAYEEQDRYVFETGRELVDKLELVLSPDRAPGWHVTQKSPLHGHSGQVVGLVALSKDLHTPAERDLHLWDLAGTVAHIQAHYDEPLKVEQLARDAGLTPAQFDRRIRNIFHISAKQFISKTRIEAACHLLEAEPDRTVGAVAAATGFYDQSAFTRQFKQAVGITPGEYRRRVGAG